MIPTCRKSRAISFSSGILILCLSMFSQVWAQELAKISVNGMAAEKIALIAGKSTIIDVPVPIKRVSLAAPAVADAMVLTRQQIYLSAKAPGITSLTLWNEGDQVISVADVQVMPDTNRLKQRLHEMFPRERDLRVTADNESLTVAGTVSGPGVLSQVLSTAHAYAPADKEGKPKIINLLQVGGVQQVMLEVRVSEMARSVGRQMGINFNTVSSTGRQFGISLLDNLTNVAQVQGFPLQQRLPMTGDIITQLSREAGFPVANVGVGSAVNGMLRFLSGGATWTVFIDALKDQGLLKVLAEPTLIALSGKTASFLAGGEFPIPVPQAAAGGTTITVEYKPFGVGLHFTPTVLDNGKIGIQVSPEVSELDFSRAVALQGFVIPSITTRRVSTTVELADGQSFAIAGLLRDEVRESVRKFPLLGDIPVLGALFKSTTFQKNETELVIVVTPHLVKPLDMAKQTLPTDQFVEPDDLEFYLLGRMEGSSEPRPARRSENPEGTRQALLSREKGLEGEFGHIMP
jgi:pilus assembly protein CpaC